jgi:hypothetical protein
MQTATTNTKLTEQELKEIQDLNNQFAKLKLALSDLELKKVEIIDAIKRLKKLFEVEEKKLIEKYGADSVINLQTGEITQKENG